MNTGHQLQNVAPLAELPIERDGNCLFWAVSAVLTGSQEAHGKIPAEVSRYITVLASFALPRIQIHLVLTERVFVTSQMDADEIWGTDVEIVAVFYARGIHLCFQFSQG